MDGFKRRSNTLPKQPTVRSVPFLEDNDDYTLNSSPEIVTKQNQPTIHTPNSDSASPLRKKIYFVGAIMLLLLFGVAAAVTWYQQQLLPVDANDTRRDRFEVKDGESFSIISRRLSDEGLIRNQFAFDLYARLSGKQTIQASTCNLSKSESASSLLDRLVKGCHDFRSITFFPGATIEKPLYKSPSATIDQDSMYIKGILLRAGYSEAEISAALSKQYDSPLFADKPAGTSLEGYIFGETYYVETNATVEDILRETFAHMNQIIARNDLEAKFKAQGLNLYQGITMASIVQRELNCEGKPTQERKDRCYGYQRSIAQVFLKRYKEGISLGSDVTFIYAADQMKVMPTVDLESPYNTRNRVGLPPGPIASPGELALRAVSDPSPTDYLFFIAGDDGLIYFAKDQAGHEANITQHCQQLCNEL